MKVLTLRWISPIIFLFLSTTVSAQETVHHEMKIKVDPSAYTIEVEDKITLPHADIITPRKIVEFLLHADFEVSSPTLGLKLTRRGDDSHPAGLPLLRYQLTVPSDQEKIVIKYRGVIGNPSPQQANYSQFRSPESGGGISSQQIYLDGSHFWYPWFNDDLITFSLEAMIPEPWSIVTQGRRVNQKAFGTWNQVKWVSPDPQTEIFLIGDQWTEYRQNSGAAETMVFLRSPDESLAGKYLEAGAQYLEMYSKLLGAYPYRKFALLENPEETGYGMPSFSLLGSRIIRLPFIVNSSFPHEILHNWWGNGVYVDFDSGNWAEGLTTYLAEHLIKEQKGDAAEFRKNILKDYTDYVNHSNDFSLREFRSKQDPASEAVGYGKTLMFFHMLRRSIGDEEFISGLQEFYRENRLKRASFSDLENTFIAQSGIQLKKFFSQWTERPGAPILRVSRPKASKVQGGWLLTAIIEQVQSGPAYNIDLPIAIHMEEREEAFQTEISISRKRVGLAVRVPFYPLRLDIDPEFDIFRRLDRNETPPTMSQLFAAEKVLVILPVEAPEALRQGYRDLVQTWRLSNPDQFEIKWDYHLRNLPQNRNIWILGWENRFIKELSTGLRRFDASVSDSGVRIGNKHIARDWHSFILTVRHPQNPILTMGWLGSDSSAALQGLERKLPHYKGFSYAAFVGDEPRNIMRDQWPVVGSPMSVPIPKDDKIVFQTVSAKLSERRALAYLPPVFQKERMVADIRRMTNFELEHSDDNRPGLDRTANLIAEEFRRAGLRPAGDTNSSYFQTWKKFDEELNRTVTLKNIIGYIPGSRRDWTSQSIVIGAPYDHIDREWPDSYQFGGGGIPSGAYDDASGVAVLLELARVLGPKWLPERNILFVAFAGKELGLEGSEHYIKNQRKFPARNIMGMLNLDTVGRLEQNQLSIYGTDSAQEWAHILMGAGFVTGVPVKTVSADSGSSDAKNFIKAGIPSVRFFGGAGLNSASPFNTIDETEMEGLTQVALVVKESIEYLAGQPKPLTSSLKASAHPTPTASISLRRERVRLGTVPDFAYDGSGVRIGAVTPGSPVEKAGLKTGDVIIEIDNTLISDVRGFSEEIKKMHPGKQILITYLRNNKQHEVQLETTSR